MLSRHPVDPARKTSAPAAGHPLDTSARPILNSTAARMLAGEVARLRALRDGEFTARRREALSVSAGDEDAHLSIGEDEAVINARIAHLESLLRHATVVEHEPAGTDIVGIGSKVTVGDVVSGRIHEYELVAWHDGAPSTVSVASPVGQAILGLAAGEEAAVTLPDGRSRQLRIVDVEQPASSLI